MRPAAISITPLARRSEVAMKNKRVICVGILCASLLSVSTIANAQPTVPVAPPISAQPEAPQDTLGRTTPRGSMLGFLRAVRAGNDEVAAQYLDTRLRGQTAAVLA